MSTKIKLILIGIVILFIGSLYFYFRFFFTEEDKNIVKRKFDTVTGQNLTITVFSYNGSIVKRWKNVEKITSAKGERSYTYFYTSNNKYVQIPDSVWYLAEEE